MLETLKNSARANSIACIGKQPIESQAQLQPRSSTLFTGCAIRTFIATTNRTDIILRYLDP